MPGSDPDAGLDDAHLGTDFDEAEYYEARTENGDRMADPSEDGLYMLFEDLTRKGNSFVVVTPVGEEKWSARVTVVKRGVYRVEREDPARGEREVAQTGDIGSLARELTIWFAARS